MFCCSNCFADAEIKAIIDGFSTKEKCEFCGTENVNVYDIDNESSITELLEGILDIYTPLSDLPAEFQTEQADLINNILCNNWHIFNLDTSQTDKLIKEICAKRYIEQPEFFDSPVVIKESQNQDYLKENSILKSNCWDDFVNGIKQKNRFHGEYINIEILGLFIQCAAKLYKNNQVLYRSRLCSDEKGYKPKDMGPPPNIKAKGGRVNPTGISILYLSDSIKTTLYEIRAGVYDFVTVGRFKLQKDIDSIRVIDLTGIDRISPFIVSGFGIDLTQYAINIEHLKMIAQEIAKPLRNDNTLDYLPTQYISDFIHSKGYDGIEYTSTMSRNGKNLAVFNPELFKCTKTVVYDIKSINYEYEKIKK